MEKLSLTPDLIVGVELIDDQHRELIDRINKFIDAISVSDSNVLASELENIFDFMLDYAQSHFSDEENLMDQHKCPILDIQKMQHQFFVMEARKLKFDLKTKGLTSELIQKSQKILVEWIKSHISGMDKKIKDCVHKSNS
ncbi:MAG: hemerythrin family protein [Spirochaetia bacterium]|nr:hemerythrin family protein [Spirochaetota bacterium]MCX8095931.1 hemerythrin family protein [Spirochaetota bacterium]MDW8112233.1 hemerythrin family protein [Spirochaetia bacterium]